MYKHVGLEINVNYNDIEFKIPLPTPIFVEMKRGASQTW